MAGANDVTARVSGTPPATAQAAALTTPPKSAPALATSAQTDTLGLATARFTKVAFPGSNAYGRFTPPTPTAPAATTATGAQTQVVSRAPARTLETTNGGPRPAGDAVGPAPQQVAIPTVFDAVIAPATPKPQAASFEDRRSGVPLQTPSPVLQTAPVSKTLPGIPTGTAPVAPVSAPVTPGAIPFAPVAHSPAPRSQAPVPGSPAAVDPMAVAYPSAPRTMTTEGFGGLVGSVRVSDLVTDPELRQLAGDTAMADMEHFKTGAAGRLSSASRQRLGFDATTMRAFTRQGVSALNEEQRTKLRDVLADDRMNLLKSLGRDGVIPRERQDELFNWVDRFDSDGSAGQIQMVAGTPADGSPARLTPSGRVMQRVLENSDSPRQFSETDFIKGFRNGAFQPKSFADTPANAERRAALAKADILERLDEAARNNPGQPINLTVPQLRALYRAVDKVDKDGSGDTFVARTGGRWNGGDLPFNVNGGTPEKPTEAGKVVAALNDIFTSKYERDPTEDTPSRYDVPPPSPLDDGDPLQENRTRLSERPAVDRDTFADYMRDARIDLSRIYPPEGTAPSEQQKRDQAALEAAGITRDKLYDIASPNGTIGGPNSEMARLYSALHDVQGGRSSTPVAVYLEGGFATTRAGRALGVLERYTTKYDLMTLTTLQQQLNDGMHFQPDKLDTQLPRSRLHILPGTNISVPNPLDRPPTVREELARLGFDTDAFQAAMVARRQGNDPKQWNPRVASDELYSRLRTLGGYQDPRPGTVALASTVDTPRGPAKVPTQAGEILELLRSSGYMAVTEQPRRTYRDVSSALAAPASTRPVTLDFDYHVMRTSVDCLVQVSKMTASKGGRSIVRNTVGSWMAKSDDNQGRISADVSDLTAGRKYIDYALDHGWKIGVGVARLNGRNLNIDGMTDHYVQIFGRHVDESGRLYYDYADSAKVNRGRFYVDPSTNLLYAPVNAPYTVGHGGYQVSHIRAFADGDFRQEFFNATGSYPREATRYHAPAPRARVSQNTSGRSSRHG